MRISDWSSDVCSSDLSNRVLFAILSLPAAFWLVVLFLVPLGFVWLISFGEKRGLVEIELTWTLANYLRAIDPLYLGILMTSVWVAGLATLICLVIGLVRKSVV